MENILFIKSKSYNNLKKLVLDRSLEKKLSSETEAFKYLNEKILFLKLVKKHQLLTFVLLFYCFQFLLLLELPHLSLQHMGTIWPDVS